MRGSDSARHRYQREKGWGASAGRAEQEWYDWIEVGGATVYGRVGGTKRRDGSRGERTQSKDRPRPREGHPATRINERRKTVVQAGGGRGGEPRGVGRVKKGVRQTFRQCCAYKHCTGKEEEEAARAAGW